MPKQITKQRMRKELINKAIEQFRNDFCVHQISYVRNKQAFQRYIFSGMGKYQAENLTHFFSEYLRQMYDLGFRDGKESEKAVDELSKPKGKVKRG